MSNYQQYGGSGWTCPQCRAFIPMGTSHSCPVNQPINQPAQPSLSPTITPTLGEIQIIAALNQIALALEKLVAGPKP